MQLNSKLKQITGILGKIKVGDRFPTRIMGIINLTKNSFYSRSVRTSKEEILQLALQMQEEGADVIDVGARSTAPYRKSEVSLETEKRLLGEAIKLLYSKLDVTLSADTTRYEPARSALEAGACILNDVYGFTQKDSQKIAKLVSEKDSSLVTTAHERGQSVRRGSPTERVISALKISLQIALKNGINMRKVSIDPGMGFFYDPEISNVEWNSLIISELEQLRSLGHPICLGASRKRFIGQILGGKPPEDRLIGSLAVAAIGIYNGAHIIRTHDVRETAEVSRLASHLRKTREEAQKKMFNRLATQSL